MCWVENINIVYIYVHLMHKLHSDFSFRTQRVHPDKKVEEKNPHT